METEEGSNERVNVIEPYQLSSMPVVSQFGQDERCGICGKKESFRMRDGTSTRVCPLYHMWRNCQFCERQFNPFDNAFSQGPGNRSQRELNMTWACPECHVLHAHETCKECGRDRYRHRENAYMAFHVFVEP